MLVITPKQRDQNGLETTGAQQTQAAMEVSWTCLGGRLVGCFGQRGSTCAGSWLGCWLSWKMGRSSCLKPKRWKTRSNTDQVCWSHCWAASGPSLTRVSAWKKEAGLRRYEPRVTKLKLIYCSSLFSCFSPITPTHKLNFWVLSQHRIRV